MSWSSPNTKNYTIGKGKVYFNRIYTDGSEEGFRDLGNCPSLSYTAALEKKEHYNSQSGISVKDAEIISQITPTLSFTLDEITAQNLSLLSLSTMATVTQVAATDETETLTAKIGNRILLAKRDISNVVVEDAGGAGTTYTLGTDYIVDTDLKDDVVGRIFFPETSTIANDASVDVTYDCGDVELTEVRSFTEDSVSGHLQYVSANPAGGQRIMDVWNVSLTPSGDTSFIGEDYAVLEFAGEILTDTANHPESPSMTLSELPA